MNYAEVVATVKAGKVTISADPEEHGLINGLSFPLHTWLPELTEGEYLVVAEYSADFDDFHFAVANDPIPSPDISDTPAP